MNKNKLMEDTIFKVQCYKDDIYQVLEVIKDSKPYDIYEPVFNGSLSDCEAYIRLREGGYM